MADGLLSVLKRDPKAFLRPRPDGVGQDVVQEKVPSARSVASPLFPPLTQRQGGEEPWGHSGAGTPSSEISCFGTVRRRQQLQGIKEGDARGKLIPFALEVWLEP